MNFEFPDENIMLITDCEKPGQFEGPEQGSQWTMVFDGASNTLGNGIGDVIISPEGFHNPFTVRLYFDCTNNMVEYEACMVRWQNRLLYWFCVCVCKCFSKQESPPTFLLSN